jgi:protein kinase-like protein/WD40 repeat protein
MALSAGTRLGPYEVLGPLGAGGMGEVYRARDTRLGRDVAIKLLPTEVATDSERLARFRREAHLLASINHPHVAAVYGLEEQEGKLLLVLELVEGEDLAGRLKRGAIPVEEALDIAKQMAEALEEAHEHGIVHRDLKPANIKLTPGGKVKVLDFGLAKAYAGEGSSGTADLSHSPTLTGVGTATGVILGTAAYMSPEQARGKAVDRRADIWAFGVVLYEMLTGKRLFQGETVSDTLAAVLKTDPDWGPLPAETPQGIRELLRRCLTRDPKQRLRDIGEARVGLGEGPSVAGVVPRAPGPSASRTRGFSLGALLLVAGALLGRAAMGLRAHQEDAGPAVRFTVTPPGSGGRVGHVCLSQDGRRLVYSMGSEQRLFVHDLGAFESRPVAGTEGAWDPFLSPDGLWVAFKQGGKLRKLALAGGDPVDICDLAPHTPHADWGSGDVILFSPAWTAVGLWRVSAGGGQPVELTRPDRGRGEAGHVDPYVLPDGRGALFTIFGGKGYGDSKVGVLDLETRRYEALFEGAVPIYLHSGHILYYKAGAYHAVPFDAARRRVTGPETTVMNGVRPLNPNGAEQNFITFSAGGVLAFVEGDSIPNTPLSRLVWVSRAGRREDLAFESYHYEAPSLSPDATRAAVARFEGGQIQVYVDDLARGTSEAVTRDGQNWGPSWHPDGRRLAVTSLLKGDFDVRVVAIDGRSAPEALRASDGDEGNWHWTPNGSSAVFVVWAPISGRDIWRANGDGSEAAPLVASASQESDAAFSPDGKWLAYQSNRSVYVAAYPSLAQRVLVSQAALNPRWSRAANELFYVEAGWLKALAYDVREGVFRPGAATSLFELGRLNPAFDVAPDGRRFLFFAPSSAAPNHDVIRVVLNGFDELRREAPVQSTIP